MPLTNIKILNYSDNQSEFIDKVNYNFDDLVEAHGGSQGIMGPTGADGAIGDRGLPGISGSSGRRGNRWYIQPTSPFGSEVSEGDFWIDSAGDIRVLDSLGWSLTGYSIYGEGKIFESKDSYFNYGGTGQSVYMNQINGENYLMIVADRTSNSGILNENLSKFVVSIDQTINSGPLMEFSKSDVEDGSIQDYSIHPIFKWENSSPSDNSLLLQIPGGSFNIGASGGFQANFSDFNFRSTRNIDIDYGNTNSGIYSTGGISMNAGPTSSFIFRSNQLNIHGGSGSATGSFNFFPQGNQNVPSVTLNIGGTSGLRTERTSDDFNSLSHNVYPLYLGSSNGPEFYVNTKGKIRIKKTQSPYTIRSSTPGATGTYLTENINWFLISRPQTPQQSVVLGDGNRILLNTNPITSGNIGIGIFTGSDGSFGTTGGINPGEAIEINVTLSRNATENSVNYPNGTWPNMGVNDGTIRYLGKGITGGSVSPLVVFSSNSYFRSVDFNILRGPTGSSSLVYYRAYGPLGGSAGSFTL
jgi:hypothetical protein